jgi:hypothetical protein
MKFGSVAATLCGKAPNESQRTAITTDIVESPETLAVAVWEIGTFYRRTRTGEAGLFLAARVSGTAFGTIYGMCGEFRYG